MANTQPDLTLAFFTCPIAAGRAWKQAVKTNKAIHFFIGSAYFGYSAPV